MRGQYPSRVGRSRPNRVFVGLIGNITLTPKQKTIHIQFLLISKYYIRENLILTIKLQYFFIILIPIGFYIVLVYFLKEFFVLNSKPNELLEFSKNSISELSARIFLLSTFFAFITLASGTIIYTIRDFFKFHFDISRNAVVTIYILLIIIASVFAYAPTYFGTKQIIFILYENIFRINEEIFQNNIWNYSNIKYLITTSTLITVFLIPTLIVGGIACLDENSFPKNTPRSHEYWKFQVERFQTNLFMSAAVLAAGVLYSKALTHYPIALFHESSAKLAPSYRELADSLTIYTGMMYSMLLAAYAIPVALILSHKATAIAQQAKKSVRSDTASDDQDQRTQHKNAIEARKYRREHGLVMTVRDVIQTIIALVAPLLTGAISSVYKALG